MGCLALLIFLSPISTGSLLGQWWWVYALASILLPLHAYRINMSWGHWLLSQLAGLPILACLYLYFLNIEFAHLTPIMLAYIISAFQFAGSLQRWSFKKDALDLQKSIDNSSNTVLLKGVYYACNKEEPEMMHFYEEDSLVATAVKKSLFEFTLQVENDQSYEFRKICGTSPKNFLAALVRKVRYIRSNYAIQLEKSEFKISESGLIQFPNGETTSWNWKIGKLQYKKIKFKTSHGQELQFQLYEGEGILCILKGEITQDFKLSAVALSCFFYSIFKHFQSK